MNFLAVISGLLLTLQSLTGCTMLNDNFDCPIQTGVLCQSLDQVNERVNRGDLPGHAALTSTQASPSPVLSPAIPADKPLRSGETVQRVWVAPYEDTDNNYHQASVIDTVVSESHWLDAPVREGRHAD